MRGQVDFHSHSTASDGQYSPRELVELAHKRGIALLALTDHDTLEGLAPAMEEGRRLGLQLIPGVELGAKEHRHLHILGLNVQPQGGPLEALCQAMRTSREERKYRIIQFLEEKGVPIPLEEVEDLAGGSVLARPHFAQVLVQHGYVATTREAFDRYLDTGEYQRIERMKADAQTCIKTIHQSGGKAVLAHPYQLNLPPEELRQQVRTLRDMGLDGLECYYPRHTPEMVQEYIALAQETGLAVSAGSDFHGERVRPDTQLTPVELEIDWLWS